MVCSRLHGSWANHVETTGSSNLGSVYVLFGPAPSRALADAEARLDGGPDDGVGCTASDAGDVDGDGFADLLAGAPQSGAEDEKGVVYLELGPVEGVVDLAPWQGAEGMVYLFHGAGLDVVPSG